MITNNQNWTLPIIFVTRSREMSHLSKISISIFLHHFLKTSKCFNLMQTPLQLDIWLQSYEGFDKAKNNMKQRNLNTIYENISKTTSPTSHSFLLIMSHIYWWDREFHLRLVVCIQTGHFTGITWDSLPILLVIKEFDQKNRGKR